MAGYVRTLEFRKKMSESAKRRFENPIARRKASLAAKKRYENNPGPFSGKKHTEESKRAMGFTKTGISRTAKQREERRRQYKEEWRLSHPEKIAEWDKKMLPTRARANSRRRRRLRKEAIEKLGGRCSSVSCGWVNTDGSHGCTDTRILQFDHVEGGGTQERKKLSFEKLCKDIISDTSNRYQLLCANCNWIKAFEKREFIFKYDLEGG